MKKITLLILLAISINASTYDCEKYLEEADRLVDIEDSLENRIENSTSKWGLKEDPVLSWLKIIAANTSVANLYRRYEICVHRASNSK